ncbi:MAG: hypothetical protein H8E15_06460 [Planctomycetes bacterium]|nr:hypothetical protein [Planctomycetota bacterium]
MISITAHDFSWIRGPEDDPDDLCAHGRVEFCVQGETIIRSEDGDFTLSAAGLFLLRTLTEDHTEESSVAEMNLLFPCCGHSVWTCSERYPVMCMGCDDGIDVWIRHRRPDVEISFKAAVFEVPLSEWREAVLRFTDQVEEFYRRSSAKVFQMNPEDQKGWSAFWQEWQERSATTLEN